MELFLRENNEILLNISEIAVATNLNPSTVSRQIQQLTNCKLLKEYTTGNTKLKLRIFGKGKGKLFDTINRFYKELISLQNEQEFFLK